MTALPDNAHLQESHNLYARTVCTGDGKDPETRIRIIESRCDLQWIIQRRKINLRSDVWKPLGYCRTKKALMRLWRASFPEGAAIPTALFGMPDMYVEGRR